MKPGEFARQWKRKVGNQKPIDIWKELDQAWTEAKTVIERPPNSFTIREYAEKNGLTYTGARRRVNKLFKFGKIKVAVPTVGGKPGVYVLAK